MAMSAGARYKKNTPDQAGVSRRWQAGVAYITVPNKPAPIKASATTPMPMDR